MKQHVKKRFKGSTVRLDDSKFVDCTFENCTIIYGGGEFEIQGSFNAKNLHWQLEDSAAATVGLLRFIKRVSPQQYDDLLTKAQSPGVEMRIKGDLN